MSSGHLALILHAHLPFVRHPEHEHFLEEEWLFEAITETYIPLILMMQRLHRDGVVFKITMSITPTLCAMLNDPLLRERYVKHVDALIDLAERERERNRDNAALAELSAFYLDTFSERRRAFVEDWNHDLIGQFRELSERGGGLEIIASAATHGLLPLLLQQSPRAARAQISIGCDVYRENFGSDSSGFWLPECAYSPGVEQLLQDANIRWSVLDAHGLMFGEPKPRRGIYSPAYTKAGPAMFGRDRSSSQQVWSANEGYPGDLNYRDFYRDIGFDLPLEYSGGVSHGMRKFTGIKYHRITGRGVEKKLYHRQTAEETARGHARHYLEQRRRQLSDIRAEDFEPIIVIPFDAELFGHWWFEGVEFLEAFIRETARSADDISLTTPSEYLAAHPAQQTIEPTASSWGEKGHLAVWIDPSTSWIYPPLHAAAQKLSTLARTMGATPPALTDRVMKQLTRELLLAQSSDWPFLIRNRTANDYATRRVTDHLHRFGRLHRQYLAGGIDEAFLSECETRHNLFPNVDWRCYSSSSC